MSEWKEYMLGDIVNVIKDRIETSDLDETNYISTENMLPNKSGVTKSSKVPQGNAIHFMSGDVLMSNIRPYFKKIWKAIFEGGCSGDVFCFRANKMVSSDFLYYLLSQDSFFDYVMAGAKGTKMPRGDKDHILRWNVYLPSIESQILITDMLSSFDNKIAINRRICENLEAQAQALFKHWFIDFAPFKDGKFFESELGMIPEGWRVVSLSDIMDYAGGSQPPASEFIREHKEGYVRFVQIRDYETNSHITYIPVSKKNKLCSEKDIMIARYGVSLGRICMGLNGAYNVALAKVFPKKEYYREYLRCYLKTNYFYQKINSVGGRAAQAGFNQSDINSFMVAFPSDDRIVLKFEEMITTFIEEMLKVKKESNTLMQLRDALLPKLMSGQIKL